MSVNHYLSPCSSYLSALAVTLLSACATMTSTKEELQSLGDNEGIVIGSVALTAIQSDADESGWAFLKGRKADDLEYAVSISEPGFNPLKTTYSVPAQSGKEVLFVKKLPAGRYNMNEISPRGFLVPQLKVDLNIAFTVKPRQTSYIGKLVVTFPDRIRVGSRVRVEILDVHQEAIEQANRKHPSIAPTSVKDLAVRTGFF
jgi:hypothetical protein